MDFSWEVVINIVQILTLIAISWTAIETFKMRRSSQNEIKFQSRPVLGFLYQNPPYPYTVKNFSNNPALNIFCFSKRQNGYYIAPNSSHVISILPPQVDTGSLFQTNGFNTETTISKKELLKNFSWINPLLAKLEQEDNIVRLVVCYEDVFKNKLYTFINSSGGSYDFSGETGYIMDLK